MAALLRLAFLHLLLQPARCKWTEGSGGLSGNQTWFLAKFCFDYTKTSSTAGRVNVTLRTPPGTDPDARAILLLLDDQEESYPGDSIGAWQAYSCAEKQAHARWWQHVVVDGNPQAFSVNIMEHVRPRWWYVVVSSCSSQPLAFSYTVHTQNPLLGWQAELSYDIAGVVQLCLTLLLANAGLALAQVYARGGPARGTAWADHPVVLVLTVGLVCEAAAQALILTHYRAMVLDGRGLAGRYVIGKLLQAAAKFSLMSMLLLVARGRFVSRSLSPRDPPRLLALLGPFCLVCAVLELWGEFSGSRTYTTDFVYATGWGHLLILLDLLLLLLYAGSLQRSAAREGDPERRHFYWTWGAAFGLWFLALPGISLLAQLLAPWVRTRVVMAVSGAAQATTFATLVVGLWPTRRRPLLRLSLVELEPLCGSGKLPGPDRGLQRLQIGSEE